MRYLRPCMWIEVFYRELLEMNTGKPGAPFRYPTSMIVWIMYIMSFCNIDYRTATCVADAMMKDVL